MVSSGAKELLKGRSGSFFILEDHRYTVIRSIG